MLGRPLSTAICNLLKLSRDDDNPLGNFRAGRITDSIERAPGRTLPFRCRPATKLRVNPPNISSHPVLIWHHFWRDYEVLVEHEPKATTNISRTCRQGRDSVAVLLTSPVQMISHGD